MNVKEGNQTALIVFYILYFVWLTVVVFLTPDELILNYFAAGIVIFYFVFLGEKWDAIWFIGAAVLIMAITSIHLENWSPIVNLSSVTNTPYWLPLAWGTTAVALRKFYIVMTSHEPH